MLDLDERLGFLIHCEGGSFGRSSGEADKSGDGGTSNSQHNLHKLAVPGNSKWERNSKTTQGLKTHSPKAPRKQLIVVSVFKTAFHLSHGFAGVEQMMPFRSFLPPAAGQSQLFVRPPIDGQCSPIQLMRFTLLRQKSNCTIAIRQ